MSLVDPASMSPLPSRVETRPETRCTRVVGDVDVALAVEALEEPVAEAEEQRDVVHEPDADEEPRAEARPLVRGIEPGISALDAPRRSSKIADAPQGSGGGASTASSAACSSAPTTAASRAREPSATAYRGEGSSTA